MDECNLLRGLPANKQGWRWVWGQKGGNIQGGNWYCKDYSVQCEICRECEVCRESKLIKRISDQYAAGEAMNKLYERAITAEDKLKEIENLIYNHKHQYDHIAPKHRIHDIGKTEYIIDKVEFIARGW